MKNSEKLQRALNNNDLYSFLIGKDEYIIINKYADVPTDYGQVVDEIIKYSEKYGGDEIWKVFENTLIKMCDNEEDIWQVIYYISCYLSYRKYKKEDFIDLSKLSKEFREGLNKFEKQLSKNKKWGGEMWKNGLIDDINRMLNNLKEDFNFSLNYPETPST